MLKLIAQMDQEMLLQRTKSPDRSLATIAAKVSEEDSAKSKSIAIKLRKSQCNAALVDCFLHFLESADEIDLHRVRPLELAHRWKLGEEELIHLCFESVAAGLLTLSWDTLCPHCRGVRQSASSLGEVKKDAECGACAMEFDTSLEDVVEVTFRVHRQFRIIEDVAFCAAEPARKRHILLQKQIPSGAENP